jgi:predicted GIY-YIG superfamily endonuclease
MNAATPHALYRFFDTDGVLLYVGITNNPSRRFTQHGVSREWWHEVDTIRMERFPDRKSVLAAEKAAIQSERPRYNIKMTGGAPVTAELPGVGRAGDYPVSVGEVVALCLAPNHFDEAECPVGMVNEVSRFGVKVGLLRWHIGTFDGPAVLVPWHQIMKIEWAPKMSEYEARKDGYKDGFCENVYSCDSLAHTQTEWTKGPKQAKESAIRGVELAARSPW